MDKELHKNLMDHHVERKEAYVSHLMRVPMIRDAIAVHSKKPVQASYVKRTVSTIKVVETA